MNIQRRANLADQLRDTKILHQDCINTRGCDQLNRLGELFKLRGEHQSIHRDIGANTASMQHGDEGVKVMHTEVGCSRSRVKAAVEPKVDCVSSVFNGSDGASVIPRR